MSFKLPDLDYSYDALHPVISKEIMELHHTKHHQTYVDKLNAALEPYPELSEYSIEKLLQSLDTLPGDIGDAVRNNGGGHYNHSLFWKWLAPEATTMSKDLERSLTEKYGNVDLFKEKFTKEALTLFGSGWVWLLPSLEIISTSNQNSPISDDVTPLLGLDVWEHAYYLDYQNRRQDYVESWWSVINWENVN